MIGSYRKSASIRRLRQWVTAAVLAGAPGCVIMDDETKSDGEDSPQSEPVEWSSPVGDSGDVDVEIPDVLVSWGDNSLTVEVSAGGSWQLGMAETGGSCGAGVACWTGEDCYLGFTASDGTSYGPYCHTMSSGRVSLEYGGNLADLQDGTTVFQQAYLSTVTYLVLPDDDSLPCLAFGDNPDYYSDFGCIELER
jgi:hypothetical protein